MNYLWRRLRAVVLACTLAASAVSPGAAAPRIPDFPRAPDRDPHRAASLAPKLDSRLANLARGARHQALAEFQVAARRNGVVAEGERVRVIVQGAGPEARGAIRAAIAAVGGTAEADTADLVQALVPATALATLAGRSDVRLVRPPYLYHAEAMVDEAVAASDAQAWVADGITGESVKVAIVDAGFYDYRRLQASGDLPDSLITQDYCDGKLEVAPPVGSVHGTAVAEIVHKMAPGAQLYLICVATEVQLAQAVAFARLNEIKILNHSGGWLNSSRGDGSGGPGTPDAIAADARTSGILWVNSGGNYADMHWSGTFSDTDGDRFHNFTATNNGNGVVVPNAGRICVALKWDEWPVATQDYDLWFFQSGVAQPVSGSINQQSAAPLPPTEGFCYTNQTGSEQTYFVVIDRFRATSSPRLDLFVVGDGGPIQYQVAGGSLIEPASSPNTMAVGAMCWQSGAVQPYSSRGPTIDGRLKPNIAGHDSTSSSVYGAFAGCGMSGFTGASAAAPHVTGAAALVKQANPSFSPAELQQFLQGRAVDRGVTGPDNEYGTGALTLGAPPPAPAAPARVSVVDAVGATIGYTSSTSSLSFQFEAVAGAVAFEYAIGSTAGGSQVRGFTRLPQSTLAFTATGLSLTNGGTYFVAVRAVDAIGRTSSATASAAVVVDTTAPIVSLTSPSAGSVSPDRRVAATASDDRSGIRSVQWEMGRAGTCTPPGCAEAIFGGDTAAPFEAVIPDTVPPGEWQIVARAWDVAGNFATSQVVAFTLSSTGITMTAPVDRAAFATSTVELAAEVSDPQRVTAVQFQVSSDNGQAWSNVGSPDTAAPFGRVASNLPEGRYAARALATDATGGTSTSAPVTFVVDRTPPGVAVTKPTSGAFVMSTVLFEAATSDNLSGVRQVQFELSNDAGATWTRVGEFVLGLPTGPHQVRAHVTDWAGNATTSAAVSFTVDRTQPNLSIVTPTPNQVMRTRTLIAEATDEPDGSGVDRVQFLLAVPGGGENIGAPITSAPYQVDLPASLGDGPHQIFALAWDRAGNGRVSPTVSFVVDTTVPTVSVPGPARHATNRAPIELSATASDTGSGITGLEIMVNNAVYRVCTDPFAPTSLTCSAAFTPPEGIWFEWRARAVDFAGNRGQSEARALLYDVQPPSVSMTRSAAGRHGIVALSAAAEDAHAGISNVQFQISQDGANWVNIGESDTLAPFEIEATGLADGVYQTRALATDAAGNQARAAAVTLRLDTTPPAPPVVTSPSAPGGGGGDGGSSGAGSGGAPGGTSGSATVEVASAAQIVNMRPPAAVGVGVAPVVQPAVSDVPVPGPIASPIHAPDVAPAPEQLPELVAPSLATALVDPVVGSLIVAPTNVVVLDIPAGALSDTATVSLGVAPPAMPDGRPRGNLLLGASEYVLSISDATGAPMTSFLTPLWLTYSPSVDDLAWAGGDPGAVTVAIYDPTLGAYSPLVTMVNPDGSLTVLLEWLAPPPSEDPLLSEPMLATLETETSPDASPDPIE